MKKFNPKRAKKKLTDLCREYIRLRDKNRCQWCNKEIHGANSHAHHIVARPPELNDMPVYEYYADGKAHRFRPEVVEMHLDAFRRWAKWVESKLK